MTEHNFCRCLPVVAVDWFTLLVVAVLTKPALLLPRSTSTGAGTALTTGAALSPTPDGDLGAAVVGVVVTVVVVFDNVVVAVVSVVGDAVVTTVIGDVTGVIVGNVVADVVVSVPSVVTVVDVVVVVVSSAVVVTVDVGTAVSTVDKVLVAVVTVVGVVVGVVVLDDVVVGFVVDCVVIMLESVAFGAVVAVVTARTLLALQHSSHMTKNLPTVVESWLVTKLFNRRIMKSEKKLGNINVS